jgi:hypothetical protein
MHLTEDMAWLTRTAERARRADERVGDIRVRYERCIGWFVAVAFVRNTDGNTQSIWARGNDKRTVMESIARLMRFREKSET